MRFAARCSTSRNGVPERIRCSLSVRSSLVTLALCVPTPVLSPGTFVSSFSRFRSFNNNDDAAKLRAKTPPPRRLIHRLVAHFLRVRFPILLALNKADRRNSASHCLAIEQSYPSEVCVRVAARTEWRLVQWRARRLVQYTAGDSRFFPVVAADGAATSGGGIGEAQIQKSSEVLARLGSSGVLAAVDAAIALRPPRVVFPVASLDTFRSANAERGALPDAEFVKPGTTVGDLYDALRRPAGPRAAPLVSGEYVRAEGIGSGARRVLRKSDEVADNMIVHIQTNKRHAWQQQQQQE